MQKNSSLSWKKVFAPSPWLALIPVGFLIPIEAAHHASWIENVYAAEIYPFVKDIIMTLTENIPFSTAEMLVYALCVLLPGMLIFWIIRAFQTKSVRRLIHGILSLGVAFGILLNLFYITWGLNYFRPPLSSAMELNVTQRSTQELESLVVELAEEADRLRSTVKEDSQGVFSLDISREDAFSMLPGCYASLSEKNALFSGRVGKCKSVLWSKGLSWAGIAGIYVGFTAEPNVNADQTDLTLLHAAAHEMAHQLGIASENEAEFIAFLACMESDASPIRYSSVMEMLIYTGNALYAADARRYDEVCKKYSDGMRRDLAAHNAYWKRFEGSVEEYASSVNDTYLKHNQQSSGVKSYGEVVDLLLAYREKEGPLF